MTTFTSKYIGMSYGKFTCLLSMASIISSFTFSQSKIGYNVLPSSSLTLSGNSNVNKFACELKNNFKAGECELQAIVTDEMLSLEGAVLEVGVMNLDCSNRRMDEDLQCALKADEYPSLYLDIQEVSYKGGWKEVINNGFATGLVEITVAGYSKRELLNFNNIKYEDGLLSVTGTHAIDMRDYNIEPPQVLWGLIKVDGHITITFELKVKLIQ